MKNFKLTSLILLSALMLSPIAMGEGPPPGHPSVDDAAKLLKLPEQQAFRYQGEVLEAIPSNGYTYLRVKVLQKSLWLAAPRMNVRKGQQIRFPPGTLMRNFYSRRLKRTFASVIFVSAVDIVPEQT